MAAEPHRAIEGDGGKVLAAYREQCSGRWVVVAALPIELVKPTSISVAFPKERK